MQANRSVRGVIGLVLGAFVVGQAAVAATNWYQLDSVGPRSDSYAQVGLAKDLVADLLPPPEYLVESQLTAYQALSADDSVRTEALTRLARLESEFRARHDFWGTALADGALRTGITAGVGAPADEWYRIYHTRFLPAIDAGDSALASTILQDELTPAYQAQRTAVDQSVRDATVFLADTHSAIAAAETQGTALLVAVSLVNLLIVAAGGAYVARRLSDQLGQTIGVLSVVSQQDLTVQAPTDGEEEFRVLGLAVNHTLTRLRDAFTGYQAQSRGVDQAVRELGSIGAVLTSAAEENAQQANNVCELSDGVSRHLQTVAVAAEELNATVRDISRNTTEAATVARKARNDAQVANGTMGQLARSSAEIGDVVKVIHSIAEQTNLLALNATIEAARAGEAGKGFAVVANEVKELARQTTQATEEITRRIDTIQNDSRSAIAAISEIGAVIERVHQIQDSIATAVEQQSATTAEISRSVNEAAGSSEAIALGAQQSLTGARAVTESASTLRKSASDLAALAESLRDVASAWRTRPRADSAAPPPQAAQLGLAAPNFVMG